MALDQRSSVSRLKARLLLFGLLHQLHDVVVQYRRTMLRYAIARHLHGWVLDGR
jgi:hypothetical protein